MMPINNSSFSLRKNNMADICLSYDVAVIQWITSCHKNRVTTRAISRLRVHVTTLATSVPKTRFLLDILSSLKAIYVI